MVLPLRGRYDSDAGPFKGIALAESRTYDLTSLRGCNPADHAKSAHRDSKRPPNVTLTSFASRRNIRDYGVRLLR